MEETEREYIREIKYLLESYIKPALSNLQVMSDFDSTCIKTLFTNLTEIFKFHER